MGYFNSRDQWVNTQAVSLTATAVTAAGNTVVMDSGSATEGRLTLHVTAATGTTPSITVNVQTSPDKTTWTTVASFTAATATGTQEKVFGPLDRYVRAQWANPTGTTPSFTFAITGDLV